MAKRIVMYNHKGGVGKTTSAVNSATYCALAGNRTLLVDMDPQGNASGNLSYNIYDVNANKTSKTIVEVLLNKTSVREARTMFDTKELETLHLLASDNRMNEISTTLSDKLGRELILHQKLKEVDKEYDYIFIDSPPQKSIFSMNSLLAANYIVIPFFPGQYEIMGLKQLLDMFDEVKKASEVHPKLLGILITMYSKTKAMRNIIKSLADVYDELIFEKAIPLSTVVKQSTVDARPLYYSNGKSPAALAYKDFTIELLERIKKYEKGV